MDEKERARALELTLGQIEKQFGKGSILRLGSKDAIVPVAVISREEMKASGRASRRASACRTSGHAVRSGKAAVTTKRFGSVGSIRHSHALRAPTRSASAR